MCPAASGRRVQLIFIPINEQEEGIKFLALVAGIEGDTTQKDWLDIWRQVRRLMQMYDVETSPTKRDEEKILLRDLTWWEWSRRGLSTRQIADKWEEQKGKTYAEDTIRAAIKRIDVIMRPISNEHDKSTEYQQDKLD